MQFVLVLLVFGIVRTVRAIDNGVGLTPPMGWRHWKAFYADINQDIIETMMKEMVKKYDVDGIPTSLKDLGYLYVGLDDHWQNCTRKCANGTIIPSWYVHNNFDYQGCDNKWHNGTNNTGSTVKPWYADDGTPRIDMHRFPDMKGMVDKAHGMGLRAGWYMGNFQCRDAMGHHNPPWDLPKLVAGSVRAIKKYGFDSVKLDSGFPVGQNLSLWAQLLNLTGRPVMIENCHQGGDGPGIISDGKWDGNCTGLTPVSDCPFNFWRTTGDPEPGWGTIMRELNSLRKVVNTNYPNAKRKGAPEYNADPPRSRPGGFAYPGTMVVGDGSMTKDENRVHFGAWCIISSPLILAFNLSDIKRHNLVWDIITNKEAITVNQAWVGHPGSQMLAGVGSNKEVEVWTKPLGEERTAVFILNTVDKAITAEETRANFNSFGYPELNIAKCDAQKTSQRWLLSPGVTPGDSTMTNVKSVVANRTDCWEIHACSTKENAQVDTGSGCKKLPKSGCGNLCSCNMAWSFNKNGTISSVMDGQCLQVSVSGSMTVGMCTGKANQQFTTAPSADGSIIVKQGDLCVDNNGHPTPPGNVTITVQLSDLGITGTVKVRDVWEKKDLGTVTNTFTTTVNHHGSVFLIFMPLHSKWPLPFKLAPWMNHTV